eukprot:CAMPEP_0115088390 /NCGR_PEP_ID=MMETSP0227-20121206/23961_1 /TAXON_ID=89957 /ORGANISM="Polarella glacialis, Strain CCMP 1383" /LENGTH=76 /DNA_ID=CAMNT_0002478647 /DNA_START=56 /DNA_END=286 /DNA_ORIENTATION=-
MSKRSWNSCASHWAKVVPRPGNGALMADVIVVVVAVVVAAAAFVVVAVVVVVVESEPWGRCGRWGIIFRSNVAACI